jgi:hypothetical protein
MHKLNLANNIGAGGLAKSTTGISNFNFWRGQVTKMENYACTLFPHPNSSRFYSSVSYSVVKRSYSLVEKTLGKGAFAPPPSRRSCVYEVMDPGTTITVHKPDDDGSRIFCNVGARLSSVTSHNTTVFLWEACQNDYPLLQNAISMTVFTNPSTGSHFELWYRSTLCLFWESCVTYKWNLSAKCIIFQH